MNIQKQILGKEISAPAIILLSLFSLIQLSGCNHQNGTNIGFLLHTLENERWGVERDIMHQEVEALGGTFYFECANQDERTQYAQAKKMIDLGVDVMIISPVESTTAAKIVRLCHDHNVKVIAYDNLIENCEIDLFVSFDNIKIGRLMAQYGLQNTPKGNYVLFWGDPASKVANWIKQGQMEVLSPFIEKGDIELIYKTFIEDWGWDNAYYYINKINQLQDENIDVVLASADGIASGVVRFYNESGSKVRPIITGQDASQMALDFMKKGEQTMTIRKDFDYLARSTVEIAFKMASNKKIEPDTTLYNGRINVDSKLFDVEVIDNANIQDILAQK